MCGIIGYIGSKQVLPDPHRRAAAPRVSRLRLRRGRRRARRHRSSCGAAPANCSKLEEVIADQPRRRRVRHRSHALGDARPADRRERPSAPRLHRPDRRRPQRDHRELPRSEAAAAEGRAPVRHRDRHRDRRAPRRARDERRRARERGAAGAAVHARAVRAGADLGRRSQQDRHRPQRPADRRRARRGRVLRRLGYPGDPQPHARRRVPRRRGDGGDHAVGRRVHRLLGPGGLEEEHAGLVGSGHGGEGRIQALHAQGDLRAAVGGEGDRARPRVGRERPGLPAGDRDPRPGRCARSSAS